MAMERPAFRQELFERGFVQRRATALPDDVPVRFQAERPQRIELPTSGAFDFARRIKILHADQPMAAGVSREQPAAERGEQGTEVEIAGRRRREAAAVARWRGRWDHKGSSGKGPMADFT